MKVLISLTLPALLTFVVMPLAGQETKARTSAQSVRDTPATVRTTVDAVLLDLVVRDKKGRIIGDLKQSEIEVYEDGTKQAITFFRRVTGHVAPSATAVGFPETTRPSSRSAVDPLRQLNLVTLVFDQLNVEGRRLSNKAAIDFLGAGLPPNTFVSVFAIDRRAYALQKFTDDVALLRAAVDKATRGNYSQFASLSNSVKLEAESLAAAEGALQSAASSISSGSPPGPGATATIGASAAQAQMAAMMVSMLRQTETLQREQQGYASLYGLLGLMREQGVIRGRKTLIFFSEGLQVPPNLEHVFRTAVGEANRSNVSVYSVDARGLLTDRLNQAGADLLTQAARTSQGQTRAAPHAVTREEVMVSEDAEESIRLNTQQTLGDLAQSTGGVLIANTNDLRGGMRKISEDIQSHYELAYQPANHAYDGKFRNVTVKVLRPDVVVQTRSGYFAMPANLASSVLPYEMALFGALNLAPPPREFEYRSTSFRFDRDNQGTQHALVMEVPMAAFQITPQEDKKKYRARVSMLVLVKDGTGNVVQKFSQEIPFEGPLEKADEFRKRNFVFMRNFRVPPGRYTLETVALDRESAKASVKRSVLLVGENRGAVGLSSLAVVKRIDTGPGRVDKQETFRVEQARIIPTLGEATRPDPEGKLLVYFVVYTPSKDARPELLLEVLQEGIVVARAMPSLPPADEQGTIPYVASFSVSDLAAGRYQIRVTAKHEGSQAMESTFFQLEK